MVQEPMKACFAKVNRAREDIANLQAEIRAFVDRRPYAVVIDPDFDGFAPQDLSPSKNARYWAARARKGVALRPAISEHPAELRWSVLIGEIVHNLRSALDQLVFGLSEQFSGPAPNPIPRRSRWRAVQFPITMQSEDWGSRAGNLWALPPRLAASFKTLQPFYRRKHPERHPLAVLEELWNGDKHRTVHVLGSLAGVRELLSQRQDFVDAQSGVPTDWDFNVRLTKRNLAGPYEERTELGRITLSDNRFLFPYITWQLYVDMHLSFTFDVAFDKRPPTYGGQVIKTLNDLADTVTAILTKYEPKFT
jgi:hypothetical protein